MHIPDGYLSPATCAATHALMTPFWIYSARKVSKEMDERKIPFLALSSAFSFVIMMFNIPIPGGTTGHAVGGVLTAILLGPYSALLSISLALLVQALLFGDGGITAFAANCLVMGLIMPFAGYSLYNILTSKNSSTKRKVIASFVSSYFGINLAALGVAVLLGIQPLFFTDEKGIPLYSPFPLKLTVPVMMGEHLLLFGFVEAIATSIVLSYILKLDGAPIFDLKPQITKKLSFFIVALCLLSPLGIIVPYFLKAGGAWGEWGSDELKEIAGFIPSGLLKLESVWSSPFPDYVFPFLKKEGLFWESIFYVISAFTGIFILSGCFYLIRVFARQKIERD
ncbi:MAG: cobalt transporter CbiM [Acidobacteria bacterium]|nr:cobalt transporter CbiM [Acidobacteriota bacterium]